ncbi:MAG: protein-glutamate O-methyltransferase CheR [Proteobacteria bacterium]|nr:protein-glutamate O-methyltransferase CheR [Pseudomonadota bacterium]MBU1717074.1 protein-glutamate O-methyltransferase CheR [Pseudomonadota bacterium]
MPRNSPDNCLSATITDREFNLIRTLVYDRFGINLTEQKRSLVVGRLQKLLRDTGFKNFQDYYNHVISDPSDQALVSLINRISTNYTYFNREKAHFDLMQQKTLPEISAKLKALGRRDLRIWSAGCSSGEEAYMLAILICEFFGNEYGFWDGGLLATDISEWVLSKAREGVYEAEQIKKIPKYLTGKYFTKKNDGRWQANERLKKEVTFRKFNLMNKTFPFKKPFQIIFCRNVMIYFDEITRTELVRRFYEAMEPDGYFFIGHSETLGRQQNLFRYLMPAVYQRI